MNHYIKILVLFAFLFGISQEGIAQCFPGLPVTGAYATGGSSPNKDRVFWLTWGSTLTESTTTHPYGFASTTNPRTIGVGAKSYGSIDLGGGRYMCVEATITSLDVEGPSGSGTNELDTYIPGTFSGDFLDDLYNIGGLGSNNKMASGMIARNTKKTVKINITIKAKTDGVPVRLRGIVVADAESIGITEEYVRATGDGIWSVAEVKKNIEQGAYLMRKETNANGTQSIIFDNGNNQTTGAVAFLTFKNTAYNPENGNAIIIPIESKGIGKTAFAIGLLTSGYDFGDAPASYGKPIHLIDDISLAPDGITSVAWNALEPVKTKSKVNVNTTGYNPGLLSYSVRRYLGTTPPDADTVDMFSVDAKGDDNSGSAGSSEEDAWPVKYKQFADKEFYKPGDKITAVIPYKKALKDDIISGWIDFNLNGTFDESERVTKIITADGDGNVTLEWTVPTTRVAYSTYVRLRYFGRNQDATSPIGNALNGEVEDHRIYILTPSMTNPALPSKLKK